MTQQTEQSAPESTDAQEKTSRWKGWAKEIGIVLVVFVAISAFQTRKHVGSGEAAPAFSHGTLSGERVSLASLEGKPTAIVFWAPWCGVCKQEAGTISEVRDAVGEDANVVSMALSYDSQLGVEAFVEEWGVDYPVILGSERTRAAYKVEAFPTIYVLDGNGRVRHTMVGYTPGFGLRARLWWVGLWS